MKRAVMETKACGCFVGFCRAETLLDALTREIMAGRERPDLRQAYREQAERCVGGWRAIPPKEGEDE
jgi:hypothetical protein